MQFFLIVKFDPLFGQGLKVVHYGRMGHYSKREYTLCQDQEVFFLTY